MNLRTLFVTTSLSLCLLSTANAQSPVFVEIDTSEGKIVLELDAAKAPKSVANFKKYVENGHYKGTIFHRVIPDFMIQGGGMDKDLNEKATLEPVRNEGGNGLRNKKYTVAMARTREPHSATSQFFINTKDNGFLDREQARDGYGYTVFGKVVKGTEVVDKIGAAKTRVKAAPRGQLMEDVPATPITINGVKVVDKKE